jgi:phenylpyruvate tautomerase PptA (4-oxalocrotonate tautomerase family)
MPVLNIHLVAGQHAPEQLERLVVQCNELFASVLRCPVDRIRVFVTEHAPRLTCLGGKLATETEPAPFFSFYVLEGRPLEDRQRLLAGFVTARSASTSAPPTRPWPGPMPRARRTSNS